MAKVNLDGPQYQNAVSTFVAYQANQLYRMYKEAFVEILGQVMTQDLNSSQFLEVPVLSSNLLAAIGGSPKLFLT